MKKEEIIRRCYGGMKESDNIGESVPLLSLKQYHLYHSISTKIIRESVPQLALNRYHF